MEEKETMNEQAGTDSMRVSREAEIASVIKAVKAKVTAARAAEAAAKEGQT